jgi:hypothetical protein
MAKRFAMGVLGGVVGYLLGAFGGGWLVSAFSSNTHDRSVEAAMTGAFVLGPLAGIVGACAGVWRSRATRGAGGAV